MTHARLKWIFGLLTAALIGAITAAVLLGSSQPISEATIARAAGVVTLFAVAVSLVWLVARTLRAKHRKLAFALYGAAVGLATCYVQYFAAGGDLPSSRRALLQVASFMILFVIINRKPSTDEALFTVG